MGAPWRLPDLNEDAHGGEVATSMEGEGLARAAKEEEEQPPWSGERGHGHNYGEEAVCGGVLNEERDCRRNRCSFFV